VRAGTAAQIGQLTGAYLVLGTVSAYEERTQGTGGGISIGGFSIGGRSDDAYIAVDLRVVNASTGEIDFSRSVEARSGGFGLSLGAYRGGFGGSLSQYENTPAGKAIRAVLMEISEYLACVMVDRDSCVAEYKEKEQKRRDKTKSSIKLD
jgi:curli biogenesis system outer membrane secretion channel CsgG